MVDFDGIKVCKYTSPMDDMGYTMPYLFGGGWHWGENLYIPVEVHKTTPRGMQKNLHF